MAEKTVPEVASDLGVHPSYVRHCIKFARVEARKTSGGHWLLDEQAQALVAEFIPKKKDDHRL